MRVLQNEKRKYLIKDATKDFHCTEGIITVQEMAKPLATSSKGISFHSFEPSFLDCYERLKRQAQIITVKDLGVIVAETGMNPHSVVLEAGSGSGAACCFFANICKHVISYDVRDDHQKVAQKNADTLGLTNITFKIGDIREAVVERDVDIILLDMPDPWKALASAITATCHGAYIIIYSPTVPQVMDTCEAAKEHSELIFIKTIENIQRPWEMDGRKVRPQSSYINHTAFLTVFRRV